MTPAPLRIARLSEHVPPHPGGKEVHVAELTRAQVARGDDVAVWWRFGAPLAGVPSHHVRVPGPGDRRYGIVSAAMFAARAIRDVMRRQPPPDVVHLHGDFPDARGAGRPAARLGWPVVLTVHGGLNPMWRLPSRAAFRHVDRFIAVGPTVADDLARCGVDPGRVTVLSSGINQELLAPWRAARAPAPATVVTVGTLDRVKGVDTVIEAARSLAGAGRAVTLVVVGDGPDRADLERAAVGLPDVRFAGRLDRTGVYEVLSTASVFVLGSRALRRKAEGTPTALLEAMAIGVPVVATRAGGIPAAVEDGVDGVLVPPDDVAAMAAALGRVLDDGELRARLSDGGWRRVAGRGWGAVADRVDEVYRDAIAERRR